MVELRENEQKTLQALEKLNGKAEITQITETSSLAHSAVMRAALTLEEKHLLTTSKQKKTIAALNQEGRIYAEKGLPERRTLEVSYRKGGEISISDISREVGIAANILHVALAWLAQKQWATLNSKKGTIVVAQKEKPSIGNDEKLLNLLAMEGTAIVEELDTDLKQAVLILKRRKLLQLKEKNLQELALTEKGLIHCNRSFNAREKSF
jgi:phenylalanyl-tRNA synthetase alpha chain